MYIYMCIYMYIYIYTYIYIHICIQCDVLYYPGATEREREFITNMT